MPPVHAKRVAVIGAGISGVCSAAHLLKHDLDVVLFERSSTAGGVWHFDKRSALDPAYPNGSPSSGDYETRPEHAYSTPPPEDLDSEGQEIAHAPPGPCYAGLKNNVSTPEMRTSLLPWPEGTEDFVSRKILEEYIQRIVVEHGVDAVTEYRTRVEEVRKERAQWNVRTTTLQKGLSGIRLIERRWSFDAVIVASGHYNMPRIPDFSGLKEWKRAWPDRVWHSKRYRDPRLFTDQNIVLVGAGVSSCDIAREAAPYAKHVYQSSRGGPFDLPASVLPTGATRVGAIKSFELDDPIGAQQSASAPIAGRVRLENGETLSEIHAVILCTGYITSYPFLSQLHSDDLPVDQADERVLVTAEGNMVHNLHKDIFYIQDASLIFIGAPYHIATFSLFDFQAQVAARVLSGKAEVPSQQIMRREYNERVRAKGLGRDFHSLRQLGAEEAYVEDLVNWMNNDAARLGIQDKMQGHTPEWHVAKRSREVRMRALMAMKTREKLESLEKMPTTEEVAPV